MGTSGSLVASLDLSALDSVTDAIDLLRGKAESLESGILSVTGFEGVLASLQSDWTALNFRREDWFLDGICQVWWVPEWFDEKFATLAPDLYSWFLIRERLDLPDPDRRKGLKLIDSRFTDSEVTEAELSHRESAHLLTERAIKRFNEAKESGANLRRMLYLVKHSARFLYDAGLLGEGHRLVMSLLDQIDQLKRDIDGVENTNQIRILEARIELAQFLTRHDDLELASRVLELLPPDSISGLPEFKKPNAFLTLGDVSIYRGDYSEARNYLEEGLIWADKSHDLTTHAHILQSLAEVEFLEGRLSQARSLGLRAIGEFVDVGSYRGQADVMSTLGKIHVASVPRSLSPDRATLSYFQQAYDLYVRANFLPGIARSAKQLAAIGIALDHAAETS